MIALLGFSSLMISYRIPNDSSLVFVGIPFVGVPCLVKSPFLRWTGISINFFPTGSLSFLPCLTVLKTFLEISLGFG